jgi:hypothetical protein
MNLRRYWAPAIVLLAAFFATSCRDRCNNGNMISLNENEPIDFFEVRDAKQVLWQIKSTTAIEVDFLRYGEVPAGFKQIVPAGSARPRPFVKDEPLHTQTMTRTRVYDHDGMAGSTSSFCGGFYQTAPREKSP